MSIVYLKFKNYKEIFDLLKVNSDNVTITLNNDTYTAIIYTMPSMINYINNCNLKLSNNIVDKKNNDSYIYVTIFEPKECLFRPLMNYINDKTPHKILLASCDTTIFSNLIYEEEDIIIEQDSLTTRIYKYAIPNRYTNYWKSEFEKVSYHTWDVTTNILGDTSNLHYTQFKVSNIFEYLSLEKVMQDYPSGINRCVGDYFNKVVPINMNMHGFIANFISKEIKDICMSINDLILYSICFDDVIIIANSSIQYSIADEINLKLSKLHNIQVDRSTIANGVVGNKTLNHEVVINGIPRKHSVVGMF